MYWNSPADNGQAKWLVQHAPKSPNQPGRTPDGWPNCGQWNLQEAALRPPMVIKATMITTVTEKSGII